LEALEPVHLGTVRSASVRDINTIDKASDIFAVKIVYYIACRIPFFYVPGYGLLIGSKPLPEPGQNEDPVKSLIVCWAGGLQQTRRREEA